MSNPRINFAVILFSSFLIFVLNVVSIYFVSKITAWCDFNFMISLIFIIISSTSIVSTMAPILFFLHTNNPYLPIPAEGDDPNTSNEIKYPNNFFYFLNTIFALVTIVVLSGLLFFNNCQNNLYALKIYILVYGVIIILMITIRKIIQCVA